jgi:hypothetical protein
VCRNNVSNGGGQDAIISGVATILEPLTEITNFKNKEVAIFIAFPFI